MIRMNITMPEEVVKKLEKVKNKSRFIAEAVKEKMHNDEKKKLKGELIEGYKAQNTQEYKNEIGEWDAISADGWE